VPTRHRGTQPSTIVTASPKSGSSGRPSGGPAPNRRPHAQKWLSPPAEPREETLHSRAPLSMGHPAPFHAAPAHFKAWTQIPIKCALETKRRTESPVQSTGRSSGPRSPESVVHFFVLRPRSGAAICWNLLTCQPRHDGEAPEAATSQGERGGKVDGFTVPHPASDASHERNTAGRWPPGSSSVSQACQRSASPGSQTARHSTTSSLGPTRY
jgi:hypothetical protein